MVAKFAGRGRQAREKGRLSYIAWPSFWDRAAAVLAAAAHFRPEAARLLAEAFEHALRTGESRLRASSRALGTS